MAWAGIACILVSYGGWVWVSYKEARIVRRVLLHRGHGRADRKGNMKPWKLVHQKWHKGECTQYWEIPEGTTFHDLIDEESGRSIVGAIREYFDVPVTFERVGRQLLIVIPPSHPDGSISPLPRVNDAMMRERGDEPVGQQRERQAQ